LNSIHPRVSVLFLSYKRVGLLAKTLAAFLDNTDYPRESLELIVSDDASPESDLEILRRLPFDKFLFSDKNGGLGANTNKGIRAVSGDFILQLQDDWILKKGCSQYLKKGVHLLSRNKSIDLIRFRLGSSYTLENLMSIDDLDYRLLCKNQREKWLEDYIYSDNPHLKRSSLHAEIGFYQEGRFMEDTELNMSSLFNAHNKNASVLVGFEEIYEHIGEDVSFRSNVFYKYSYQISRKWNSILRLLKFKRFLH
jgi:glycosyltransferase involved in cell wall biosynthesis